MSAQTPRLAVYTGSFDPITLGHLNVIERGNRLYREGKYAEAACAVWCSTTRIRPFGNCDRSFK